MRWLKSVYTIDVERQFLHAENVGRNARVVALETRQKRHDDESWGWVARPKVAAVFLRMRQRRFVQISANEKSNNTYEKWYWS